MSPAAKPRVVVTEQASLTDRRDESLSSTGTRQPLTDLAGKKHGPTNDRRGKKSRRFCFPWSFNNLDAECTLPGEHKHGWKPVTLGFPVLGAFAIISLLLAAIIEVLAQQSQIAGGLALSSSPDDFPTYVSFSYLFLPTIIAVIYSLFWSWVDLDAKRLQAWFELSKDEGATARDSLLLSYPYDFVGFVPFTSLRRRHWPTFCAGTTMVVIFWFLTPLQSAILGTDQVLVGKPVELRTVAELRPAADHAVLLDQSVLNEGYAITWLNQPLPEFTALDYTIMPFEPLDEIPGVPGSNWTGISTKYWTTLDCWPAKAEQQGPPSRRTFSFSNGRGCNVSDISPHPSTSGELPYKMLYFGNQPNPFADYALQGPDCSDASHQYLATWARYDNSTHEVDEIDLEATFCEANYYAQQVRVTIASGDRRAPVEGSVEALEPASRLSNADFNVTAFEYLLGAGVSSVEPEVDREFPFGRVLEQWPRTVDLGLTWPMSPMVGFAVGLQGVTDLDAFQDRTALAQGFNATHKLLFSLAIRQILTNSTIGAVEEGGLEYELYGVVVSRLYSAIVEGLLVLVSLLAILLAWFAYRAPCGLSQDASSLESLMRVVQTSSTLLEVLSGKGALPEDAFTQIFQGRIFRLVCGCKSRSGETMIEVIKNENGGRKAETDKSQDTTTVAPGFYSPVKPWALRRGVGFIITLIMAGVVAALAFLKNQEQISNGLAPPNVSFEVAQILLSYLPVVLATSLEPFWVLVNRVLCVTQPFKDLWSGRRSAKGSINARYTSVPPQLVLWRAAGAGHFLLATLSAIALLSNLLAVGLGGMFDQVAVPISYETTFERNMLPKMSTQSILSLDFILGNAAPFEYAEPFYVAMNNLSRGTPLPPWIGHEYCFESVDLPAEAGDTTTDYIVSSRGFSVNPSCSPAGTFSSSRSGPRLNITITRNGTTVPECPTSFQPGLLALDQRQNRLPSGPSAAETVETPVPGQIIQICDTSLVLGWSRSSQTQDEDGQMETSFVICQPKFETAKFELTVNAAGYVLESALVSEVENSLDYEGSSNHTDTMVVLLNHLLQRTAPVPWHNDTLSQDWMNYLLKIQPGWETLTDPRAEVPDLEDLANNVSRIYRQLYALILGLNSEIFERSSEATQVQGRRRQMEERIFMPLSAFIISVVVLGLNILTAIVLYGFAVKHFLPRMPTTIGSTLAYVAPSRAVREHAQRDKGNGASRTFSFGRYIGDDGRAHVGIELDPFVVPVRLSSLRGGNTKPGRGSVWRRVFTRKNTTDKGDTWL